MGPSRLQAERRWPLPPAVRAILWLDAVLVVAAVLALFGLRPLLGSGTGAWTLGALAGSTLTAALAALAAFELAAPGRRRLWKWLPAPAFVLWLGASGAGCFAFPETGEVWGATLEEAGKCLKFLLAITVPLLALMLFMLWRTSPHLPARAMAFGGLAASGAAASLLSLVHPHQPSPLDLGAHAVAIGIALAVSAAVARLRTARAR